MEVRLRKARGLVDSESSTRPNQAEHSSNKCWKISILFILCLILLLALFPSHQASSYLLGTVATTLAAAGLRGQSYAVVIDAGSTGSRVLAFSIHHYFLTGRHELVGELWREVKPGLSSYAERPEDGAQSISQLILMAKEFVPESFWSTTPITLKATAGLRLLPSHQSEALLGSVENILENSGFKIPGSDPLVEIMSELNEGIFAWVTVNFLLKRLDNLGTSVVALDLGGASTQISFVPSQESTLKEAPVSHIHQTSIAGSNVDIYTHSYLGLGLMAARRGVLKASLLEEGKVASPCVGKDVEWEFHGEKLQISAAGGDYQSCQQLANKYILSKEVQRTRELVSRELAAFSYYYDRALEAALIPATGGRIKIHQLTQAAEKECSSHNNDNPFLCLDLAIINALLTEGYGLPPSAELELYKKIDGHEASWALGAAFSMLQSS